MKILIPLIVILLLFFASTLIAQAASMDRLDFETFRVIPQLDNTQKLLYLTALAVMDYHQAEVTIIAHPDQYYENNPVLGKHPSRGALIAFGIIGITATALISRIDHLLARIVVDSIVATEQLNVWENKYRMRQKTFPGIMIVASFQF